MDPFRIKITRYNLSPTFPGVDKQMEQILRLDMKGPISIGTLPLPRCKMFHNPEGKTYISFNLHHSIADEQSLRILICDVCSRQGRDSPRYLPSGRRYIDFCLEESRKPKDAALI